MIRNVAVFCASSNGLRPVYRTAAENLGRALAIRNIGVIYGGADVGLMQAVQVSGRSHYGHGGGAIHPYFDNCRPRRKSTASRNWSS